MSVHLPPSKASRSNGKPFLSTNKESTLGWLYDLSFVICTPDDLPRERWDDALAIADFISRVRRSFRESRWDSLADFVLSRQGEKLPLPPPRVSRGPSKDDSRKNMEVYRFIKSIAVDLWNDGRPEGHALASILAQLALAFCYSDAPSLDDFIACKSDRCPAVFPTGITIPSDWIFDHPIYGEF